MDDSNLFKNTYNEKSVKNLWERVLEIYSEFDINSFVIKSCKNFENEELKERSNSITKSLAKFLPENKKIAWEILYKVLENWENQDYLPWFKWKEIFILMPVWNFYKTYLISEFELSIKSLYLLTKLFTSEFEIRAFIKQYPNQALKILDKWTIDENHNVRRLVSEGTRPLLPWAERLPEFIENPKPVLNLLSKLVYDESLYVRKSVANNLNDISKHNPNLVIDFLKKHKKDTLEFEWLKKHALRTLIKKWDINALKMVWISDFDWEITNFKFENNSIKVGDNLEFSFEINPKIKSHIVIDYGIWFIMKNNKHSKKVFKLKKVDIENSLKINKKHSFKIITTRKYYPWEHFIEIQINWKIYHKKFFTLKN